MQIRLLVHTLMSQEAPSHIVGGVFRGVRVVRITPKFRNPCRMILVNTVPNPKSVAPKLQKLQSRKVSISVFWGFWGFFRGLG